jgi:hypothetical protein
MTLCRHDATPSPDETAAQNLRLPDIARVDDTERTGAGLTEWGMAKKRMSSKAY